MSDEMTTVAPPPNAVDGVLARLRVDDDEVRDWAGTLGHPTAMALRELLTALEPLVTQIAEGAVEGSSADQPGVMVALIVRCWALAVRCTVHDLRSLLGDNVAPPALALPGSQHLAWLAAHYAADPAAARRDGLDLLAGDVLG
jgi:hypothetical protein